MTCVPTPPSRAHVWPRVSSPNPPLTLHCPPLRFALATFPGCLRVARCLTFPGNAVVTVKTSYSRFTSTSHGSQEQRRGKGLRRVDFWADASVPKDSCVLSPRTACGTSSLLNDVPTPPPPPPPITTRSTEKEEVYYWYLLTTPGAICLAKYCTTPTSFHPAVTHHNSHCINLLSPRNPCPFRPLLRQSASCPDYGRHTHYFKTLAAFSIRITIHYLCYYAPHLSLHTTLFRPQRPMNSLRLF
ncbi:hypothetical protein BJV77DRAFT_1156505 [Russula vinacea]|nr:hypothetical protein BJV77DRAFT_1156505 [Russula vinacea]